MITRDFPGEGHVASLPKTRALPSCHLTLLYLLCMNYDKDACRARLRHPSQRLASVAIYSSGKGPISAQGLLPVTGSRGPLGFLQTGVPGGQ